MNVPAEQLPGKIIFQWVILILSILILTGVTKKIMITERTFLWGVAILMVLFLIKNAYALLRWAPSV